MLKISTFNVNSIRARLPQFLRWLKNSNPDIVCLQELKCEEKNFPFEEIADAGYNIVVNGQKTYNGVAILSKFKIEEVVKILPNIDDYIDDQARYIEAVIDINSKIPNQILRIASIYVPNGGSDLLEGQAVDESEKFKYKMHFFTKLHKHVQNLLSYDEMQIFAGDFNVAKDDIDIYDPIKFNNQILFHPKERQKLRSLINLGLIDVFRAKNMCEQAFTWWDYRQANYQQNKGARIDYIFASPNIADKLNQVFVEDKGVRDQDKPSDHCPLSVTFDFLK